MSASTARAKARNARETVASNETLAQNSACMRQSIHIDINSCPNSASGRIKQTVPKVNNEFT